ncbi:putative malate dehydrogenase 1B [Parambassis ranga]|uniref:Malate dehydrogenase 1B n=1 Tax=Parambassis ranga TaxID=210632 RepID=A0A6P7JF32_9TELE|nr:putative malate dehydrogenase 1B [Parambassis ranga]
MAKFVLAGKADCPHYAKAELLADTLKRSLPDFRVHKLCMHPGEWKEWLEAMCERNGWKHEHSPLVWRELVEQGGKGMLLGGFSDFLDHCQDFYGITSDMSTDLMLSITAENVEAKMNLIAEEQHHVSLIKPLHIWISGACSTTCQLLIPSLLSAEVFPGISAVSLHLLHLEGNTEELCGLKMEIEDLALSMLHQATVHTDLEEAFQEADVVLLLDDRCSCGENEDNPKEISEIYRQYGRLIDTRANKQVKVIVSGDLFVNLRCSLLVDSAHSINSHQFVAMATQLENEARALIAEQLKVKAADITDVIVWGNISGIFYIDLQRARVFNYDGAIKGPAFFSLPVQEVFCDRKWLETDFQHSVRHQREAVAAKTGQAPAMSAANGILTLLKAWNGTGKPDEVMSLGLLCPGSYNLPEGIVLSVPATFTDGKWSVLFDVSIEDKLMEQLQQCGNELQQEKELVSDSCK